MRRLQSDNYKKLVPLKRIAEASSYSFGYVSILVQRKKLKAKKIGNKYYSTKEWFDQYLELHARDEKRLSPEAVKELSPDQTSSLKPASESMASAKLKSQIDNLVERAIKEKFEAQIKEEKITAKAVLAKDSKAEKIIARQPEIAKLVPSEARDPRSLEAPRNDNAAPELPIVESLMEKPEEKDLAEILNNKIVSSDAKFIADFVEPEERLKIKWQENLNQEAKDLLKQQGVVTKKIKTQAKLEARARLAQKVKVVIFATAILSANISSSLKEFFKARKNNLLALGRRALNVVLIKAQEIKAALIRLAKAPAKIFSAVQVKADTTTEKLTSLSNALKSLVRGVSFFAIGKKIKEIIQSTLPLRGSSSERGSLAAARDRLRNPTYSDNNQRLPRRLEYEAPRNDKQAKVGLKIEDVKNKIISAWQRFWIAPLCRPRCLKRKQSAFAGMTRGVAGMTKKAQSLAINIAAAKKTVKQALTFKPFVLKTAAAALIVVLAIISLNRFAPGYAASFNQMAKRTFSNAASQARALADRGLKSKYLAQVSEPIEKVKKLPDNPNVVIPGSTLAVKAKASADNLLLNMADSLSAASLKFENNLKRRNQILAARLGRVKEQALFVAGFWQGQYEENIDPLASTYAKTIAQSQVAAADKFFDIKLALGIIPKQATNLGQESLMVLNSFLSYQKESIGQALELASQRMASVKVVKNVPAEKTPLTPLLKVGVSQAGESLIKIISRIGQDSLAALTGFVSYQGESMGEVIQLAQEKLNPLNPPLQGGRVQVSEPGQVAGVAEISTGPSPMSRLLALANTTSRRSQEVINQAKYSAVEALENTAVRQKELSLNFGQKLASLT
ncbi:MAG: hypothetical protein Q8O59_00370, partial [bacterium]|nr:hypothetical protein [bacterium]